MKAEIEIDDQIIADNLVAAFEGGSNYWLGSVSPAFSHHSEYSEGKAIAKLNHRVVSDDGDNSGQLTPASLAAALVKMKDVAGGRHLADLVNENGDADTGDVLLQLAVFGEVIYG